MENQLDPTAITPTVQPPKRPVRYFWLIVLIGICFITTGGYAFMKTLSPQVPAYITTPPPQPTTILKGQTVSVPTIKPTLTYSSTDQTIPFVRDGNVYLYQNGQEQLIAKATQKSSPQSRHDIIYPFLSPNGKYLAFIALSEEANPEIGTIFVPEGTLTIYNLATKQTTTTSHTITDFRWNLDNELEFQTHTTVYKKDGQDIDNQKTTRTFIVFNPSTLQIVTAQTLSNLEQDQSRISFPFYGTKKTITFSQNMYYLTDNTTQQKKPLISKDSVTGFAGWSPDGTIATFLKDTSTESGYLSINTKTMQNLPFTSVNPGGAGGEVSAGIQWYFNKGFVTYCSEQITFIDGSKPLELTHTGGGGCNNEEGFVATSPNGEYAVVKFDDRFELHTKSGDRKKITELSPLSKNRFSPKKLQWLNNDFMAIYESTFAYNLMGDASTNPSIYLFDRKANTIKPVIPNAYLGSFAAGIP